jgi:chromosome segregation ATPase
MKYFIRGLLYRFRRLESGLTIGYVLTQEREQLQSEFEKQAKRLREELDAERRKIKNEWAIIHNKRGQVEIELLDVARLKRQLELKLAQLNESTNGISETGNSIHGRMATQSD